jgi:hypothetical protein
MMDFFWFFLIVYLLYTFKRYWDEFMDWVLEGISLVFRPITSLYGRLFSDWAKDVFATILLVAIIGVIIIASIMSIWDIVSEIIK